MRYGIVAIPFQLNRAFSMPISPSLSTFPPPLKSGGTVGIISPSRWPEEDWLEAGRKALEQRGYKVVIHPQNLMRDGQLAGDDKSRAAALMEMFANPEIDAIMCARGGTGALRILDLLDYDAIRANPKPFAGFSDITVLLQAITSRCGMTAWHAPMFWNLAQSGNAPRTARDLFAALASDGRGYSVSCDEPLCLREGVAEGVLVGGNMSLLQYLIGTPYDWSGDGAVLFLEDADEPLYKIDMTLRHFAMAGKFKNVKAVIVGEMVGISDGISGSDASTDNPYGRDLKSIALDNLPPEIPVCLEFPCGHGSYTTSLPIGARVKASIEKTKTSIEALPS